MELYKIVKNMGDMRLNINGYKIAIFSELICKYSNTLKMIKERDGLDKVINIELCDVIKHVHVDALFYNLYILDGKEIDALKYSVMISETKGRSGALWTTTKLAFDLLTAYLCIDIKSHCHIDTDNMLPNFMTKKPWNPNGLDKQCNDARYTYRFIREMYDGDKYEEPLLLLRGFDIDYEGEDDEDDEEAEKQAWYKVYEMCIELRPKPRILAIYEECKDISRGTLHAALALPRAQRYICDVIGRADIPVIERISLWYELIMEADKQFKECIKSYLSDMIPPPKND
jgi:hypothetical protein